MIGDPSHQRRRVFGKRSAIAVAHGEQLGADDGAIRALPQEAVLGDRGSDASPQHGITESGLTENLGHLAHVPEHVREVADLHGSSEVATALDPHLKVAHDRLPRHEELVHEDVPGADTDPTILGERSQPSFVLGANLEVVVEDRHLAIEHESGVARVVFHQRDQRVEQLDQLQAKGLERLVPLAIPVRVRHDGDVS